LRDRGATAAPPRANAALAAILDGERDARPMHVVAADEPPAIAAAEPTHATLRRWARRIAAPSIAGAVLFGGLASAGALPGPCRPAAARAGAPLGGPLPGRDAPGPSHAPSRPNAPASNRGAGSTTATRPTHKKAPPRSATTVPVRGAAPPATNT